MAKKLSDLAVGTKLKLGKYQVESESPESLVWQVAAKNHTGYPSNSVTMVTKSVIDARGFDAKEPSNSDSIRKKYGNNRYKDSNIRQWLNKSGQSWFVKAHAKDEPPTDAGTNDYGTGYDDKKGFLSFFDDDERGEMLDTDLKIVKPGIDGGGSETVTDKVFLLSTTEVGLANEGGTAEGSKLDLFSNDSSRIAKPTKQAVDNSNYSHPNFDPSKGRYYWLRTPDASNSHRVRRVYSDGALGNDGLAYYGGNGIRPALNLKSEIFVSDKPDSDGAHTIQWNAVPTIDGSDSDLGESWSAPQIEYNVNDEDADDTLTVIEKLNGSEINKINDATRDKTYDVDLSNDWNGLSLGEHNVTITVSDGQSETTRKYTFTKTANSIKFQGKQPIETAIAAKEIVLSAIIELAPDDILKIEACNNAFDDSPNWEEVTQAYKNRKLHEFNNNQKTASKWGINYRLEIDKVNKNKKSYVEAIGINFGISRGW